MKPGPLALLTLLILSLSGVGRACAEDQAGASRPLNLSLPREPRLAERIPFGSESRGDPGLGPPELLLQEGSHNARLPYGSGYEARQRGLAIGDRLPGNSATNGAGWGRSPDRHPGRGGMGRGR